MDFEGKTGFKIFLICCGLMLFVTFVVGAIGFSVVIPETNNEEGIFNMRFEIHAAPLPVVLRKTERAFYVGVLPGAFVRKPARAIKSFDGRKFEAKAMPTIRKRPPLKNVHVCFRATKVFPERRISTARRIPRVRALT